MEVKQSLKLDISAAKDALVFGTQNRELYEAIIHQYQGCVAEKLEHVKSYLFRNNPALYEQIMQRWINLSPRMELQPVFLYPEMLNRLFVHQDLNETGKFMVQALDAELAKRDKVFDTNRYDYLWTLNGDFFLNYNKETGEFEELEGFRVFDVLPLDFFSPYCIKTDARELQEQPGSIIDEYDYAEAYSIYEQVYDCLDVICDRKGAEDINDLIYRFTTVILPKRQHHESGKRHFFSSSDGYYVGRTVLGNVELVNPEILIDSIVHEATHALLYMIDEKYQWQPSPEESDRLGNRILSPWSGNMLSVRNYLQAIFVWFGLYNLWKYALDQKVYDPAFAQQRIELIRNGFQQVDIRKTEKDLNHRLHSTLIDTVMDVKEYILKS